VKVGAQAGGLEHPESLAYQGRQQPGQHVAGPAGGHAGVAGAVDEDPLAVGDDGSGPFQDDHERQLRLGALAGPFALGGDGGGPAIGLDVADGPAGQCGEFARVRRHHQRAAAQLAPAVDASEVVQPVCVDDNGLSEVERGTDEFGGAMGDADAGPDRQHVAPAGRGQHLAHRLRRRLAGGRALQRNRRRARTQRRDRRLDRLGHGHGRQPRPAAEGGVGRQGGRADHAARAAHHQHAPEAAFVGVARARRKLRQRTDGLDLVVGLFAHAAPLSRRRAGAGEGLRPGPAALRPARRRPDG